VVAGLGWVSGRVPCSTSWRHTCTCKGGCSGLQGHRAEQCCRSCMAGGLQAEWQSDRALFMHAMPGAGAARAAGIPALSQLASNKISMSGSWKMKEEMPATTPRLEYCGPSSALSSGTPRMTVRAGKKMRGAGKCADFKQWAQQGLHERHAQGDWLGREGGMEGCLCQVSYGAHFAGRSLRRLRQLRAQVDRAQPHSHGKKQQQQQRRRQQQQRTLPMHNRQLAPPVEIQVVESQEVTSSTRNTS